MESKWRQRAWDLGGGLGPWRLAARLVTPILGFEYIAISPGPYPQLMPLLAANTQGQAVNFVNYMVVNGPGFPYGLEVEPDLI